MEDRVQRVENLKKVISDALSSKAHELISEGHDANEVYDACCHAVHDLVEQWLYNNLKKEID